MAYLLSGSVFRAFDANGDPLPGAKLFTYDAGTSTPKAAYLDRAGAAAHPNPIVLDANGQAVVWLDGRYKLNLLDAEDVQQPDWPLDDVGEDVRGDVVTGVSSVVTGAAITAGGLHATSATATAVIPFTTAVLPTGTPLSMTVVIEATPISIPYTAGENTYWLIFHASAVAAVPGWTRVGATHYLWQVAAGEPPLPVESTLLLRATVSGEAITAVLDYRQRHIVTDVVETISSSKALGTTWTIARGAHLKPAAGVSLALRDHIQAGDYRIFDTSLGGTITFPDGGTVKPAWWGAAPGQNSAAAIQAAMDAGPANMTVLLGRGTYLLESQLSMQLGGNIYLTLGGQGAWATTLQRAPSYTGILFKAGDGGSSGQFSHHLVLENLGFDGLDKATNTVAIRLDRCGFMRLDSLRIRNCWRGVWLSGGSYITCTKVRMDSNTRNMRLDNAGNWGLGLITLRDCNFIHATEIGLDIDGSVSTSTQVRMVNVWDCAFEADQVVGTADIGTKMSHAQNVHFTGCWWESNGQHVQIDGGDTARPSCFLTWRNCSFGDLRGANAFTFNGTGANDGMGSVLQSCALGNGAFTFNQNQFAIVRDLDLLGTATLAGGKYLYQGSSTLDGWEQGMLPTDATWRLGRISKAETGFTSRTHQAFITGTTTTATATPLGAFQTTTNAGLRVTASVVARAQTGGGLAAYTLTALYRNNGGTLTLIGAIQSLHPAVENLPAWDATLTVGGGNIYPTVTGEAGLTIRWNIWLDIMQVVES